MKSSTQILGTRVDPLTYQSAVAKIHTSMANGGHQYVSIANVHLIMEAHDDSSFREIVNRSVLITPDGMPLVWGLKLLGHNTERVYGPSLTKYLCEFAEGEQVSVGFFGSTVEIVENLKRNLLRIYPALKIDYVYAPPFPLTDEEKDDDTVNDINNAGIKILFVGLGCPKQEIWMAEHIDKVNAIMIGVGAAFDFIAGVKPQAPLWIQKIGLEWLFRLAIEPGRLWKRYLYNNPRFVYHFGKELISKKLRSRKWG